MADINVIAVDVGSLLNIGWWRDSSSVDPTSGRDLDSLVDAVSSDLLAGALVALRFEAPLFVPAPSTQDGLNRQRVGEKGGGEQALAQVRWRWGSSSRPTSSASSHCGCSRGSPPIHRNS